MEDKVVRAQLQWNVAKSLRATTLTGKATRKGCSYRDVNIRQLNQGRSDQIS